MGNCIDLGLAGPDDPIYKGGLRVSSVLGPSALTNDSQSDTDGTDPLLQKQIVDRNRRVKVPARRPPSTTRK